MLPLSGGVWQHCLTWKDSDTIVLLGGIIINEDKSTDPSLSVFEFNIVSEEFTPLPDLTNTVIDGGCKVITTMAGGKELIALPGK